jgi:fucose permease
MLFEVARYSGVILAAWVLRRRIDRTGAKPFMLVALGIYAAVAVYWWFYLHLESDAIAGIVVCYFLLGLGMVCWTIANLNYLPKVSPEADRTLMVSLHGATTAFIGGLSPIVWGLFLRGGEGEGSVDIGVFQVFFVVVFVSVSLLSWRVSRLPEETVSGVDPLVIGNAILRPFRAATYLVNLIDLKTLGEAPVKRPEDLPRR